MEKLIIANWKSNPATIREAVLLAKKIERAVAQNLKISKFRNLEVVIAPPFPFLGAVGAVLQKTLLGAQDAFWEDVGPFTGEVSWRLLKVLGIRHVIVGHSERRMHAGETDGMVNKKVSALLAQGMIPILCVGEREREGNAIPEAVGVQLKNALQGLKPSSLGNLVVAYEPIWAISTTAGSLGPATPDNALQAAMYIRKMVGRQYGPGAAQKVRVIYGGSVNADNVVPFLREGKMEGALVGGASLRPDEFIRLLANAA